MPSASGISALCHLLAIIGASCILNQVIRQTPENFLYEGSMNVANLHVCFVVFLFALCTIVWLNKVEQSARFGAFKWGALVYPLLGMSTVFVTGLFGSYSARHGWVDFSYANINAIRIAWESTSSQPEFYNVFARDVVLKNLGLVDRYMPSEMGSNDDIRENFQIAFVGALFLWIGGSLLGSGMNGAPFTGAQATAAGEGKVSGSFGVQAFLGLLVFILALVATFVVWTSDAAADPSHPFYEFAMQTAGVSLVAGTLAVVGTINEQRYALEFLLYITGFFLLTAPIKLFQILAFVETPEIKASMASYGYTDSKGFTTESIITAEVDRYSVAVVFQFLMGLISIVAVMKSLNAKNGEKTFHNVEIYESVAYSTGDDRKKNIVHYVFIGLSFLLIIAGAAQSWYVVGKSMEFIDAEKSYRNDAANFYIILILVAWMGFAVNYFEKALFSLKPLWWVSCGIAMATFLGYNNVGTHDRQLWMIDYSLAGVNELRAFMNYDDKTFFEKRALGIDEKYYDAALGGDICVYIGMYLAWIFGMKLPFTTIGKRWTLWESPTLKDGTRLTRFVGRPSAWALAAAIFGLVGFFCVLSMDLAAPPIHNAGSQVMTTACSTDIYKSDSFNLFVNDREAICFGSNATTQLAESPFGERFTLDVTTSWQPLDRKYWEIFTFSLLALNTNTALTWGYFAGCTRSVKFGLIHAAFLLLAIVFPFKWDINDNVAPLAENADAWGSRDNYADYACEDNTECGLYKAGFTFYFLSAVCAIACGMNILGEVDQLANGGGEREIALTVEHKKEIASVFHTLSPEKQQEVINLAKEMKNSPTGATKQTGV